MRSKLWTPAEAIDEITGAKLTIDYGHHEIHEGNHYKAGRADTSLAAEDTIELLFVTPTITADGTKMIERWIGGDGFKTSIGGEHRGDSEFILKQNTKYLVRLTAVGDAIKGAIGGDWYEYISK